MTIRQALPRDFEETMNLLIELDRPAPKDNQEYGAFREQYLLQLGDPDTCLLVAEELSAGVVGFLSLYFRNRLNWLTPEAWIADLIVAPAFRGRGIGKALLRAAYTQAAQRRAHWVRLEAGSNRIHAHQLFISNGLPAIGRLYQSKVDAQSLLDMQFTHDQVG